MTTEEYFGKILSCLDDLSDAKGVSRCGLVYVLAQYIIGLREEITRQNQKYETRISELEGQLLSAEDEPAE